MKTMSEKRLRLILREFKTAHCLTWIAVDNYATGAVHDGFSSAPDFCAEIVMRNDQNSKRAKGQQ